MLVLKFSFSIYVAKIRAQLQMYRTGFKFMHTLWLHIFALLLGMLNLTAVVLKHLRLILLLVGRKSTLAHICIAIF